MGKIAKIEAGACFTPRLLSGLKGKNLVTLINRVLYNCSCSKLQLTSFKKRNLTEMMGVAANEP